MADIMFKRFTKDIKVVVDSVMFNNDNYKLIKDIRKDVEENIVKYKEILTHLEGLYSARANKYKDEVKELTENFKLIEERRCTVRTKLKDALEAVEEARNKEQQQRRAEDVPMVLIRGDRDGEKQFKMPTGAHPECISSEFTPLMADNWQGDNFHKNLFKSGHPLHRQTKNFDEVLCVHGAVATSGGEQS
jgi:hypothetical protein